MLRSLRLLASLCLIGSFWTILCSLISDRIVYTDGGISNFNRIFNHCASKNPEYDSGRRNHPQWWQDKVYHVHRFHWDMVLWCSFRSFECICVETDNSICILYPVSGRMCTIFDYICIISEKNMDDKFRCAKVDCESVH